MQISALTATDTSSASSAGTGALGRDDFLRLLVDQLKNQDPLEPAKNEQMLAQLAQFSSLEEMQQLNDNIVGLAVLQQSNALLAQLTSSSSLIGRQVEYVDPTTQESRWGTVESVRIDDGVATLMIDGASVPLANVQQVGSQPDGDGQGS